MKRNVIDSWRAGVRVGLVVIALAGLTLSGRSATPADKTREQEIADVEKKIETLNKQLEELKKPPVAPPPTIPDGVMPQPWVSALSWRSIGPATMGGRITAISVFDADPTTYWVATASGGLLKTINNGITFEHQFDHENTVSVGDVCVAPSDRNIVWVGTGESNPRNSVSFGDGVYKSTDGGKKWSHMGLNDSFQIGKILIHPKDPNIVYVGALGRLYGSNPERGVFKTSDGGKTWEKALHVDDKTGCIDMRMSPADPNTIIAAMWERKRDEFDSFIGDAKTPRGADNYGPVVTYGKGGGLFRTTDAGKTWKKIDKGVPAVATGRIGLDWYQKDPKIVFAIIDSEKVGTGTAPPQPPYMGFRGEDAEDGGVKLTEIIEAGPAAKAGLKVEDILRELDGKRLETYEKTVETVQAKKVGDKLKFKLDRGEEKLEITVTLEARPQTGPAAAGGMAQSPYIGLRGENGPDGSVKLTEIIENGPASKAGLKVDDVVVELDGKKLEGYDKTIETIQSKKIGDKLKFKVKRGDTTTDIVVTLEARPQTGPGAIAGGGQGGVGGRRGGGGGGGGGGAGGQFADQSWPGFSGRDSDDGIIVRNVTDDSSAAKAGIKADDIILELNGKAVAEFRAMMETLQDKKVGDKVKFLVQSGGEKKTVEVTLEQFRGGGGGGGFGRGMNVPGRPYIDQQGMGGQAANRQNQQGAEGFQTGGVYKSTDAGETWTRINSINPRPMYFSQVRVDPSDDKYVYVLGTDFSMSTDGGKSFRTDRVANRGVHSDQHALWINPKDGRHMLIGTDGGFYVTHDRMKQWEHLSLAALGQFYHVCVDNRKPYRVYGGLQDNGSWGGPSRTLRRSGPMNEEWFRVGEGDGFVCRVDPYDADLVYSESQDGEVRRRNLRTGQGATIRTGREGGGGRGGAGGGGGPRGAPNGPQHRFNWNSPFIVSTHNPGILYLAGEKVYRSVKHGDDLKAVSPEITRTKRGSATALSESPRNPDVLWVGADDGALWVTRDGGREWKRVDEKVGLPGPRWVSTIEASRFAEGRAYVCFDAHRSNDVKPYLYVTEDYGQTWKPIMSNMPSFGSTRCLREDVQNQNLLFCGTEFAVFASTNRGGYWTKINSNLPTVAVHELAIHPTAGEMVAATHGRSLWVVDISPLRQMTAEVVKSPAHLYTPVTATRWREDLDVGRPIGSGSKKYFGKNPEPGAAIYYSLGKKPEKISLKVLDYAGQTVRELSPKSEPGLHKVVWDLTRPSGRPIAQVLAGQADAEQVMRRPGGFTGQSVQLGQYRIVLNVDGKEFSQGLRVEADPTGINNGIAADGDGDGDEDEDKEEEERGFKPLFDPLR